MFKGKISSKGIKTNKNKALPSGSFYDLTATTLTGEVFSFEQLKGKKVLIVNTASDCGYTAQYEELQKLYEKYQNELVILAFPSNDFKEQEKLNDEEIQQFCRINYGVTFPVMKKCVVIKTQGQHEVFQWMTDASKNGWNNEVPVWNFSKYLLDESGILTNIFAPSVSPLNKRVSEAIRTTEHALGNY